MSTFLINNQNLTVDYLIHIHSSNYVLSLAEEVKSAINKNRKFLEDKIKNTQTPYYGINTGFGSLCNVRIDESELKQLQHNLVRSHACGAGYQLQENICKLIFLLKILNLSKGYSGVRLELIEHMIKVYNAGIYPLIFEQGSLGASGDLAPLAHLSLTLIGEGKCYYKGATISSIEALEKENIKPIELAAKEGLALLNGTQFSLAHSLLCINYAKEIITNANILASMSMEAYGCSKDPLYEGVGVIRNNNDQLSISKEIGNLLFDSKLAGHFQYSVQDPYSFRCVPQVHGASLSAYRHIHEIIENELNAVTDNPNIFDAEDLIISAGNFHAQNLALVLDYLCIAMAEIGSISERRTYQLINGERDLPVYLTQFAGLNSGFMIAQYTAASITSQNKQLCTPSSVDSIVSSRGQEDHVSMAANAATKCMKVIDNVKTLLAIEYLCVGQALDFRGIEKACTNTKNYHSKLRGKIPTLATDRVLHDDIYLAKTILFN